MSFDDLIGLLVFLLFVGVPLFNRIRRGGGRRTPQKPQPPGAPNRVPGEPTPTLAPAEFDPDDPIGRRLEEARRRVEAARGSGSASAGPTVSGTSGGGAATVAPATRSAPQAQPASSAPFLPPTVYVDAQMPPPQPTAARSIIPASAPLKVERRKRSRRSARSGEGAATTQASDLMRLEPKDIVRGILWHQILSEPVAHRRRGRGRQPSPPRSR